MIRRSAVLLSKTNRTIVRDPRKARVIPVRAPVVRSEIDKASCPTQFREQQSLPFEPTQQNRQSVGSNLASYMLAGAGMTIGFSIVGAIFSAI